MNRIISGAAGLIVLLMGIAAIDQSVGIPHFVYSLQPDATGWNSSLQPSYNAYFSWRADPALSRAASWTESISASSLIYLTLIVLYCGLFALYQSVWPNSAGAISIAAALLCVTLVMLFGFDALVLSSLAWWPLFVFSLVRFERAKQGHIINAIAAALLAFLLAKSANQLALPLAAAGIWLAAALSHPKKEVSPEFKLLGGLLLIIPAAVLFRAPLPYLPEYPALSHVVPDDGIPGNTSTLIGGAAPIPFVDRYTLRSLFCMAVFLLVILSLPVLRRRHAAGYHAPAAAFLAVFLTVLLLDCGLPEGLAQIAPLQSLPRILPGVSFFPLLPVVFATAMLLFGLACAARGNALYLIVVLFAFWIFGFNEERIKVSFFLEPARLQRKNAGAVFGDLSEKLIAGRMTNEAYVTAVKVATSPSHYLLWKEGVQILSERERFENAQFSSCAKFTAEIHTSARDTERAHNALCDGSPSSRWSEKTGKQNGGEFVFLRFPHPLKVSGIELSPGKFIADFPRGVDIACAPACENAQTGTFQNVASLPSFQGAVQYTSDGYPYYGGQDDVRIFFPAASCGCLRVTQTGRSGAFDWSIAELGLLAE